MKTKINTVFELPFIAPATVLICCIIDAFTIFGSFESSSILPSSTFICLTVGAALGLDVPLGICGTCLGLFKAKMFTKSKMKLILILSIICFAIAFAISVPFKIFTSELYESNNYLISADNDSSINYGCLWSAIFNAIIPLCTSLASFVVSYFSSDPIRLRKNDLEKHIEKLKTEIIGYDAILAEAGELKTFKEQALSAEENAFEAAIEKTKADAEIKREKIKLNALKKIKTPDAVEVCISSSEI